MNKYLSAIVLILCILPFHSSAQGNYSRSNRYVSSYQVEPMQEYCTTLDAFNVRMTSATVRASINVRSIKTLKEYGIELSTPSAEDYHIYKSVKSKEIDAQNRYVVHFTDLIPYRKYSYRAYYLDGNIKHVGEWKRFTTVDFDYTVSLSAKDTSYTSAKFVINYTLNAIEHVNIKFSVYLSDKVYLAKSLEKEGKSIFQHTYDVSNGSWRSEISNSSLYPGRTYYAVVKAEAHTKVLYSNVITINTDYLKPVDLGLPSGTKWGSCNLGQHAWNGHTVYFAWGDTTRFYNKEPLQSDYKWYTRRESGKYKIIKYNTQLKNGRRDHKTHLDIEDDAACAILGGNWSTPTKEQFEELVRYCDIDYSRGQYVFTSTINGKSIAFPPGVKQELTEQSGDKQIKRNVIVSYYWTSDLTESSPWMAGSLMLSKENDSVKAEILGKNRGTGAYIRPVWKD